MIETDTNVLDSLGLSGSTAQASTGKSNDLGRADFLQLMLTQIQHQNPLNPMNGEEFVAQLAQFSTVQGIETLNQTFSSVASALHSDQFLQASGLVGQDVLVPSDNGYLAAGSGLSGRVGLTDSVPDLTLKIYDPSGQLVRTLPLGPREQGLVDFTWEGLDDSGTGLDPGMYRIVAEGTVGGETNEYNVYTKFPVEGVTLSGDGAGILLSLPGLGAVPFDWVLEIQ